MKKLLTILGLILAIAISPVYGLSIDLTTNSSDSKVGGVVVITEKVNSSEEIKCIIHFEVDPTVLLLPDYGYFVNEGSNFKYIYRVSTIPERTEIHLNIRGIKIDVVINKAFYLKNG
ncbi:hypothetical protein KKP90_01225 [Methanothermococcus sp. SCGC AD-155-E23]|nr:hypothetical protein [Methanothermococcus sp. SCGC AD-155-E23]